MRTPGVGGDLGPGTGAGHRAGEYEAEWGPGGWGRASNHTDTHFSLTATGAEAGSNRNDLPRVKD